ncbi:MAG: hypothetical protein ABL925_04390, partial [Methylococcales bacterium]
IKSSLGDCIDSSLVRTNSINTESNRRVTDRRKKDRDGAYTKRFSTKSIPHIVFPDEVVRFASSCLSEAVWSGIKEESRRFIATLGCKLEPIVQIVPPTPTPVVLGFECLGLGSLGENFLEICKETENVDHGLVRLCLAVVAIKTISQLRTEAIRAGHHDARSLIFSMNLDPFMIDSQYFKIFLKWYFSEIAHNVVFEINETTTKQYLKKLKNLQVDYELRYSADDLNDWHPEVRSALLSRVEMTKMDYKSFIDAMEDRGEDKEKALNKLLEHNLKDKPLVVEGVQDPDYLEFLRRHWDFKKYGHLYGQGYIIEPNKNLDDRIKPLNEFGLPGGNYLTCD